MNFEELMAAAFEKLEEDRKQIKEHLTGVDPEQASFLHTCLVKNTALVIELARLRLKEEYAKDMDKDELKKEANDIYNQIGDNFSGRNKDENN